MQRKPRKQWRGNDLKLLRKLHNVLKSMRDRDDRQATAEDTSGIAGFYFAEDAQSGAFKAMQTLTNRIAECLAATT